MMSLDWILTKTQANQLNCERNSVENSACGISNRVFKICYMEKMTAISSNSFTISATKDNRMEVLSFQKTRKFSIFLSGFKKIFHSRRFSLLTTAYHCSIKVISKDNFRSLNHLKSLLLGGNHIEKIKSSTLEDLTSLEFLDLGENY